MARGKIEQHRDARSRREVAEHVDDRRISARLVAAGTFAEHHGARIRALRGILGREEHQLIAAEMAAYS